MNPIILGSQSARRKEILQFFSLPFEVQHSSFDELSVPFTGDPKQYVCDIAKGKAAALAPLFPKRLILTADTIVYKNEKVYLKPNSKHEAKETLTELSASWHEVYTGLAVSFNDHLICGYEVSRVLFNDLTEKEIETFLQYQPYQDKAGSYFIQLAGSLLIKKIEGCFYNIMGLPVNLMRDLLKKSSLDLWDYTNNCSK